MIGKAQNGQKLPFGPYTLPQVTVAAVLLTVTSIGCLSLPVNPAISFIAGLVITVVTVFAIGLIPYTGVRLTSRVMWVGRLILSRKPVSASGMPVDAASAGNTLFIEESVVVILPSAAIAPTAGHSGVSLLERLVGDRSPMTEGRL
ncbi:hypothetical protein [Nocardia heshunensis]